MFVPPQLSAIPIFLYHSTRPLSKPALHWWQMATAFTDICEVGYGAGPLGLGQSWITLLSAFHAESFLVFQLLLFYLRDFEILCILTFLTSPLLNFTNII